MTPEEASVFFGLGCVVVACIGLLCALVCNAADRRMSRNRTTAHASHKAVIGGVPVHTGIYAHCYRCGRARRPEAKVCGSCGVTFTD